MGLPYTIVLQTQVAYNSSQLHLEDILESIRDAGFEADLLSSKLAEASGKASRQSPTSQHAMQTYGLCHNCIPVHGYSITSVGMLVSKCLSHHQSLEGAGKAFKDFFVRKA